MVLLIGGSLLDTADSILALEVEPDLFKSLRLLFVVLPELIGLLNQVVVKHVLGSMLVNKDLILGVLFGVAKDVTGVTDGLGLVQRALAVILFIGEHFLGHLIHLLLLCNRLELGLFFLDELKDVSLNSHLLKLLRVFELQVCLHQSQTN